MFEEYFGVCGVRKTWRQLRREGFDVAPCIVASIGSVGDSYDNALAEMINELSKAEVIHRCGPWRSFETIEYATLE